MKADEFYEESFDEVVEYTERIVKYESKSKDKFIYTLAHNCYENGIPMVETMELMMPKYGLDASIKGIIRRAYKATSRIGKHNRDPLMSLNLLKFAAYKHNVDCQKRVLFEALLIKFMQAKGSFAFTIPQVKKELGIDRSAGNTIIDSFRESGFLYKFTNKVEGYPKPLRHFDIHPEKLPQLAEELMTSSKEFIKRIMPVLEGIKNKTKGFS